VSLRRPHEAPQQFAKVTTMAKDEPDILDAMLTPDRGEPAEDSRRNVMVIGVRAKSAEEIEAREKAHLTNPWPIAWFAHEDDELPEPLSKEEAADLYARTGITAEEFRALNRRRIKR
jgi:hypothetical protein